MHADDDRHGSLNRDPCESGGLLFVRVRVVRHRAQSSKHDERLTGEHALVPAGDHGVASGEVRSADQHLLATTRENFDRKQAPPSRPPT